MKVTVHTRGKDIDRVIREGIARLPLSVNSFINGVVKTAEPITPKKEGELVGSVSKEVIGRLGRIVWQRVYAGYQEFGQRLDGSHRVKKYTTPGTDKHFASKSVEVELAKVNEHVGKAFNG